MEPLTREATDETPKVIFDKANNTFEISGKSLPEDVDEFFDPILDWLEAYIEDPNDKTELVFKMDYFNTASSKMLLDILLQLEELQEEGKDVKVYWYYREGDVDMAEAGEEYNDIVALPFELQSH